MATEKDPQFAGRQADALQGQLHALSVLTSKRSPKPLATQNRNSPSQVPPQLECTLWNQESIPASPSSAFIHLRAATASYAVLTATRALGHEPWKPSWRPSVKSTSVVQGDKLRKPRKCHHGHSSSHWLQGSSYNLHLFICSKDAPYHNSR